MAHILVVDDEVDFLPLLDLALRRAGHEVTQAESGEQALQQMAAHHFDLLIVDNLMPQMTGLQLLERMRAAGNRTPAVVMTAFAEVDNVVEAMHLGVEDFLVKPFAISSAFISTVNRCLQISRSGP